MYFRVHRSAMILTNLRPKIFLRWEKCLSSTTNPEADVTKVLIYKGNFAFQLRLLKQVSISSSILSMVGMPIALTVNTGVPFAGQIAIASTALFTSVSSTLFLQALTYPYVSTLHELIPTSNAPIDRKFVSERRNMLGMSYKSYFNLSQVEKVSASAHPFASFKANNSYYYVFGGNIADKEVRSALTKD
eukprot:gene12149-25497_t